MSKYTYEYNGYIRWEWMMSLADVIKRIWIYPSTDTAHHQRGWHVREQRRYDMHPVIRKAVLLAPPLDWHNLVLEWPHISVSNDTSKIAYTRSEQHGIDDRQTVTSVGKYITRHFPTLRDHEVRDLCGMYGVSTFKISRDMDEMLDLLHRGPRSCMVWSDDDDDFSEHPYQVYDPALGWGLAVRIIGSSVDGRALVNDTDKSFVRSYARNEGGYSGSDEALASWLVDQGYTHRGGWREGLRLKYIPVRKWGDDVPLAPYIDGGNRVVRVDTATNTLVIDDGGDWMCDNTDGYAQDHNACFCPSCNERVDEDNLHSTYDGDGDSLCEGCINNDYYYVYGRRGYEYYVHRNDMVEVRGNYYHDEYLSDNGIVALENGEYEEMDYAVSIDGCWYSTDDEDIVCCEDTGEYALIDDTWCCEVSGNRFINDEPVRLCDVSSQDEITVHEDNIDRYEADLIDIDITTTIEGA